MSRSFFYKLFPPPSFLTMPTSGVDISDESIHIAEIEKVSNGCIVKKYGKRKIPKGVIESGRIKNVPELKKIFTQIRKEEGLRFVNVSLPEQHGYVVTMRIPKMKQSEIYGNLELNIEEHVPILAKDAVIDYDIVQVGKNDEEKVFIELNVSVYPKEIIEEYMEVFKGTGITPLCFEIEAYSVARAVIPKGDKGTFMILDFGKTRTGVTIASREVVHFTSTLNIGGDILTQAIARNFSISFDEAENLKKKKSFLVREDGNRDLLLALLPTISALTGEVNKHYQYWNTHKNPFGKEHQKIDSLLLCGGLSNLAGFSDYLSTNIHVDVSVANVFKNINSFENYIPEIPFEESLQYATSIGLALSSNK